MGKLKTIIIVIFIVVAIKLFSCTPSDQQPQLGNGYKIGYNQRGGKITIIDSNNYILISDQVLNYAFDSTYIVAVQKPLDSIPECGYKNNESLSDCKEAFERSKFRQYWIINKKQKSIYNEDSGKYSNIYGPLTKKEYLTKLKVLGIPKDLKLKEK